MNEFDNREMAKEEDRRMLIEKISKEYGVNQHAATAMVDTLDRLKRDGVTSEEPVPEDRQLDTIERRQGVTLIDMLPGSPPVEAGRAHLVQITIYSPDRNKLIPGTRAIELLRVTVKDGEGKTVSRAAVTSAASEMTNGVMVNIPESKNWAHPGQYGEKNRYINDPARRIIAGDQPVWSDSETLHEHLIDEYKGRGEGDIERMANRVGGRGQSEAKYYRDLVNHVNSVYKPS